MSAEPGSDQILRADVEPFFWSAEPFSILTLDLSFEDPRVVLAFGPVTPIEVTPKNRRYVLLFNTLMRFGAATRLYLYTLGCNTAFRYEALKRAGMYRIMDAGMNV